MTQTQSLYRAGSYVSTFLLFAIVPALLTYWLVLGPDGRIAFGTHDAVDFRDFWWAANDVLHGRSPYHPAADPSLAVTADCKFSARDCYVYPPLVAFLVVPLTALPFTVAGVLFVLALAGSIVAAMRILGVTDWRVFGVAFLCVPVGAAIAGGTISPLLALGLAILWQRRDEPRIAAPITAALVVAKLFLWPLFVWLVVTRRARTAMQAAILGLGATLLSWALIGFAGLRGYPDLLRTFSNVWERDAYSLVALVASAGGSTSLGLVVTFVCGVALVAVAAVNARSGNDWTAFVAIIAAALALSPVVWPHYFVLLLVPLAVASPQLSWRWALPVLFALIPSHSDGALHNIGIGLALAGTILAVTQQASVTNLQERAKTAPLRSP